MPSVWSIKMEVEGLAPLLRKLRQLAGRTEMGKVARKAMYAMTTPVLKTARDKVRVRYKVLKRSLGRRIKTYRQSGVTLGLVGPRKGFRTVIDGKPVDPINYAHLVEFGRKAVRVKKARVLSAGKNAPGKKVFGQEVRAALPWPYLRPAFDVNRERVQVIGAKVIKEELRQRGFTVL